MNETPICRLCLKENVNLLNIFCDTLKEGNAYGKILKYLHLDIKENDQTTKDVCLDCLRKIEEFHSFCEQVVRNQQRFQYQKFTTAKPQHQIIFETTTAERLSTPATTITSIPITSLTCGNILLNNHNEIIVQIKNEANDENTISVPISVQYTTATEASFTQKEEQRQQQLLQTQEQQQINFTDDSLIVDIDHDKDKEKANYNKEQLTIPMEWNDDDSNCSDDNDSNLSDEFVNEKSLQRPQVGEKDVKFPEVFIKDEKFIIHGKKLISLITKFYKLSCDLCIEGTDDQNHSTLASLFNHYKNFHFMKGYVLCCGQKLSKLRKMALHMARHLQPDAFKCPECGKIMTSPKILRYHIQNHLPEEKRPLACSQCPRRFSYSSALVAHQICHLPEEQRNSHVCDECGKTFLTSGRLLKHINSTHVGNNQQYICHTCGKQFACKGNFNYHLATHEKIHQVQCETCGKWLKNKLCLRKHMTQHSTVRHNCPKCNYSTTNRQCLQNHMRVQHSNEKPYTCEECGRDFKLKNTLINHMVQHTGERRYTCEFCNKQFASSGNYYAHRKRMHPNQLAELNQKKEEEMNLYRKMAAEKRKEKQNTESI